MSRVEAILTDSYEFVWDDEVGTMVVPTLAVEVKGVRVRRDALEKDILMSLRLCPDTGVWRIEDRASLRAKWGELGGINLRQR